MSLSRHLKWRSTNRRMTLAWLNSWWLGLLCATAFAQSGNNPPPAVSAKGEIIRLEVFPYEDFNQDDGITLLAFAATDEIPPGKTLHPKHRPPVKVGTYEIVDELLYMDRDDYRVTGVVHLTQPDRKGAIRLRPLGDQVVEYLEYGWVESHIDPPWREHELTRRSAELSTIRDHKFIPKLAGSIAIIEYPKEPGAFRAVMVRRGKHNGFNWSEFPDRDKSVELLHFTPPKLQDGQVASLPQVANIGAAPVGPSILGRWVCVGDSVSSKLRAGPPPKTIMEFESDRMIEISNPKATPTPIRWDSARQEIDMRWGVENGKETWVYGVYRIEDNRLTIAIGVTRPKSIDDSNTWRFYFSRE